VTRVFRANALSEATIYEILANRRRRETIRHLAETTEGGPISLRELSEEIAARETETSPPPSDVRESVYNSLHQTHLPQLDDLGVVTYDRDARAVTLSTRARDLSAYMEVVTDHGLTWSEIYRTIGVVGLTTVVAAQAKAPLVGALDPLVCSTVFLALFAVVTASQLWSNRGVLLGTLRE